MLDRSTLSRAIQKSEGPEQGGIVLVPLIFVSLEGDVGARGW